MIMAIGYESSQALQAPSGYTVRDWKLYRFATNVPEWLKNIGLSEPTLSCRTNERFLSIDYFFHRHMEPWTSPDDGKTVRPFYRDLEQMSAGFDKVYGSAPGIMELAEDWNGHPKGALVSVVNDSSLNHIRTYMVEDI